MIDSSNEGGMRRISTDQPEEPNEDSSTSRAAVVVIVVVGLLVAGIGGAIGEGSGDWISRVIFGESSQDLLDRQWERQGVLGLELDLPVRLTAMELTLSPEDSVVSQTMIDSYEVRHGTAGQVELTVARVTYQTGIIVTLQGGAQGAVDRLAHVPGASEIRHEVTSSEVWGGEAIRVTGTFLLNGSEAAFEALLIGRGQTMWQVQAIFPEASAYQATVDRILAGVAISQVP